MSNRLLVFDDDATLAMTIAMIAETAGFEARTASSPDAFFRELDAWSPSHIALDLIMPELDGVQVMARLADLDCRAGLIITSGVGSRVLDAAVRSANEHGLSVIGQLPKPFLPSALRAMLQGAAPSPVAPSARAGTLSDAVPDAASLAESLDGEGLFLAFQPQIDCESGQITGFEALARWRHPRFGVVAPDVFIPLAEREGLIDRLTDRVLDMALAWLRSQSFGPAVCERPTVSINVSAQSLTDRDFVPEVLAACKTYGVESGRVILEVTESVAMSDPVAALDQLTRLRMKGFQLSIDDFGTGFSSVLQLARLPFSEIKIDKSFVMDAMRSPEASVVVRSIVDLGRSLGLRSVAEGVEDKETLSFLRAIGCDQAQGYHVARPMVAADLARWLEAQSQRPVSQRPGLRSTDARNPEEAVFRWTDSLMTGIAAVDERHRKLVEIINALGDLRQRAEPISVDELDRLFGDLHHSADHHFRDEERLMVSAGVDSRHRMAHIREHRQFLAEIPVLREQVDTDRPVSLDPVLCYLVNWLAFHILGIDQSMARQIAAIRRGAAAPAVWAEERALRDREHQPVIAALTELFKLLSQRSLALREEQRELSRSLSECTAALAQANEQLAAIAMTDPLTGVPNRRHALNALAREWAASDDSGAPLCCLLIDADGLKPINDQYGHEAGNRVIQAVARRLQDCIRTDDLMARMGSDEFLILAPGVALEAARQLADRVHRYIADLQVPVGDETWYGSVSIGVAQRDPEMAAPEALVRAADAALCAAKRRGGHQRAEYPTNGQPS